jgi:hypothetical protein
MRPSLILRTAAIYNLAYALLLAVYPAQTFHRLNMPETPDIIIQGLGMMVGVYGLGYWIAGSDPVKYWPLVAVGLLGKTLGPIGFAAGLIKGVFFWKSAPMFVLSDLIWWLPFWAILFRGWRSEPEAWRRMLL